MKAKTRFLLLLICVVFLICARPITVSAADDFPTVLAETKKGVVQIYGVGENSRYISSWVGTGFAVGEEGTDTNVFLTNWHVVSSEDYSSSQIRIWILQENCEIDKQTREPDPGKSIECKILKTTTGYPDYAIIQAKEAVSGYTPLPLKSSKSIPDGTKVYALGYPAVVGNANASHYGIDDITVTDGIVSQHMQYAYANDTWILMHTAQISGGNSGGPLITEDGYVVGLNTYGFGENKANLNRYCAVYIDYAIDGLDDLELPYQMYVEETEPIEESTEATAPPVEEVEEDDNRLLPLTIVAGVILMIAIVLMKKKKKAAMQLKDNHQTEGVSSQKKEEPQEKVHFQSDNIDHIMDQHQQSQEVKAHLRLNGSAVYPVTASGCVIGRERDCTIVLPENTAGVSRYHCKLEFQDGQFVLTDLSSSYGTYVYGKRIPANTPIALKSGTSFYLGSENCKFTLC